jgi:acyl-coenzyme A synthetase/AMP-(fatty) acid ligase
MITNLPGCQPMKPGAASLPMFGVRPVVVDPASGAPIEGNNVEGVLCVGQPFDAATDATCGGTRPRPRASRKLTSRSSTLSKPFA